MNKQELRDAIYDEFVQRYYQSGLCEKADNFDIEMCNFGRVNIEEDAFELMEELADATLTVMHRNGVLKASKQEHQI